MLYCHFRSFPRIFLFIFWFLLWYAVHSRAFYSLYMTENVSYSFLSCWKWWFLTTSLRIEERSMLSLLLSPPQQITWIFLLQWCPSGSGVSVAQANLYRWVFWWPIYAGLFHSVWCDGFYWDGENLWLMLVTGCPRCLLQLVLPISFLLCHGTTAGFLHILAKKCVVRLLNTQLVLHSWWTCRHMPLGKILFCDAFWVLFS